MKNYTLFLGSDEITIRAKVAGNNACIESISINEHKLSEQALDLIIDIEQIKEELLLIHQQPTKKETQLEFAREQELKKELIQLREKQSERNIN